MNLRQLPILLIAALLLVASCGQGHRSARADLPVREINELKTVIEQAPQYEETMFKSIDSLRLKLKNAHSPQSRFRLSLDLSEKFRQVNTDSSLHYATSCLVLSQECGESERVESLLATINALSTAGIFSESLQMFNALDVASMDSVLLTRYWLAGRTLYSYMRSYVAGQQDYYDIYSKKYLEFDDSLRAHLPATDKFRMFIECEQMVGQGKYDEAARRLEDLMKGLTPEQNLYGMAAFQMAEVYRHTGSPSLYAAYLAKASISDVKGCIREGMALPTLAVWLYEQGELTDAFGFINFALEDAMKGNARMRTVSIAKMVPMIDTAYRQKIDASNDDLTVFLLLSLFMFVVTVALVVVLFRYIHRMRDNERKLSSLSKVQETYIGHFIGLCATYADRLDSLSKTVSRKLTSGQADELLKLVNSGKFTDANNEKFYAIFDKAFLDIYPDFIEQINSLLRPEEQIKPKEEGQLSPEMRIYAFVRLGVEESTRIAQILHYSVSTVYAYRNRMRNRAIDRSTFDRDVLTL